VEPTAIADSGRKKRLEATGRHATSAPRAQASDVAGGTPKRSTGTAASAGARAQAVRTTDDADELYRLAGKIVCVVQEVANKVEMCVASKRNERDRYARVSQDSDGARSREPRMPPPGQGTGALVDVPDNNASIKEKVKYLKYYWREMRVRWQYGVSEEQFASYIIGSDGNRNIVAHSTVVHNDGTLTNVQKGTDYRVEDLERFLSEAYRARDSIDRLCEYMDQNDYAAYVRQRQAGAGRRPKRRRGGRSARSAAGKTGAHAMQAMGRSRAE